MDVGPTREVVGHGVAGDPLLACVILAHADPHHLRRLVDALDPFPVFLHCDVSTSDAVFNEMTRDLPSRCTVLPRMATGWAKWENVAAEVAGYRQALATTNASHVAVLTGSDYPIATTEQITDLLTRYRDVSFAGYHPLPYQEWGPSGGFARLRYLHWVHAKRMIRLPIRRKMPTGVVYAGGSQLKVLARKHAAAVVRAVDERPELVRFFRRTWIADETFVGSILSTPEFAPSWATEHVFTSLWWIGWDGSRRKSPPWLGIRDLEVLRAGLATEHAGVRRIFARKFSTAYDTAVLDAIDREVRGVVPERG